MTAKDIEKLFEKELGLYEVCVWNYDEKNKILDMYFVIDFTDIDIPITHESIDLFGCDFGKFVFDNVTNNGLSKKALEIENNRIIMEIETNYDLKLYEYLKEFFTFFLKKYSII